MEPRGHTNNTFVLRVYRTHPKPKNIKTQTQNNLKMKELFGKRVSPLWTTPLGPGAPVQCWKANEFF